MTNGNTFVAVSQQYMYEVDENGTMVWQYNAGPAKAFRYECDYPGLEFVLGANPCGLNVNDIEELEVVSFYPNPSNNGIFQLNGIEVTQNEVEITIVDMYGKVVLKLSNEGIINLSDQPVGIYFATVSLKDGASVTRKLSVIN